MQPVTLTLATSDPVSADMLINEASGQVAVMYGVGFLFIILIAAILYPFSQSSEIDILPSSIRTQLEQESSTTTDPTSTESDQQ